MRARVGAALVLLAAPAGCVTEKPDLTPGLTRSDGVPSGPVASPGGTTTTTHVRTEVIPLGSVAYDGLVLPMVSPGGRWLAVEQGVPPTWEALLAEPGASPPDATTIVVYDLAARPPARVSWPAPPPRGLVLGRSSDQSGLLVEAPQADGSRWIGRVGWLTGRVEWLAQGSAVNAHAVFTRDGGLLFTRRAVGGGRASLVLRSPDGTEDEWTDPSGSYAMPMVAGSASSVYALVRTGGTLEVEALRIGEDPSGDGRRVLSATGARSLLALGADAALAYQVAAPAQCPHPGEGAWDARSPLVLYHPRLKRMASIDERTAAAVGLAAGSVAAVPWSGGGRDGFFCSTPQGLVFTPAPTREEASSLRPRRPDARMLSIPYVPRLTGDPDRPVLLLGPDEGDPGRLVLFHLRLGDGTRR